MFALHGMITEFLTEPDFMASVRIQSDFFLMMPMLPCDDDFGGMISSLTTMCDLNKQKTKKETK